MTLSIEETDNAILATFHSMEEGQEYILNDFWFSETNGFREKNNCSLLNGRNDYIFSRKGEKLFLNGQHFDFNNKINLAGSFTLWLQHITCAALSFVHNGIEKLN